MSSSGLGYRVIITYHTNLLDGKESNRAKAKELAGKVRRHIQAIKEMLIEIESDEWEWSNNAINYECGVTLSGTMLIPNKIGCFVRSYKYSVDWQKKWKSNE